MPTYIPVLVLISSLAILKSKEEINYLKSRILIFLFGFSIILISESSLKFVGNNLTNNLKILGIPFLISLILYFNFKYNFIYKFKVNK